VRREIKIGGSQCVDTEAMQAIRNRIHRIGAPLLGKFERWIAASHRQSGRCEAVLV